MRRKIGLVVALAAVGFFACGANAAVMGWDFDADPDTGPNPMTRVGTGYGTGTGLVGDGTAIFWDSLSVGGNNGFIIGGWTGGYTFDIRVKVLESVTNSTSAKSLSFKQYAQDGTLVDQGRGVALDTNAIRLTGNGTVRTYGADLTDFRWIRLSVPNDGNVYPYLWDASTSTWIDLGFQGLGQSGPGAEIVRAGIALGSLSGSGTTTGKFVIDTAGVDSSVARGAVGAPIPEPATLALLALGAIPMLRRRR